MQRPGSSLSRIKNQAVKLNMKVAKPTESKQYTVDSFIKNRDFRGALTMLEFQNNDNEDNKLWLAYAYFHNGDYE